MFVFLGAMSVVGGIAAAREAGHAKGEAQKAKTAVAEMENRLDRALLACEAMWSLVRDKLGVSDTELLDRINEIDLSDGMLDGKVRKTPVSCPSCNRTISPRFPKCMYCGKPIMHDPFA